MDKIDRLVDASGDANPNVSKKANKLLNKIEEISSKICDFGKTAKPAGKKPQGKKRKIRSRIH